MTRLLVVGDALLDRDVLGRVERVCPDAPVPVVDVVEVLERPGGAGLAALLASDVASVDLVTALGDDEAGRRVRAMLAPGVRVHALVPSTATITKTRVRAAGQSLLRVDDAGQLLGRGGAADLQDASAGGGRPGPERLVPERLGLELARLLEACDAVLVADYGGVTTRHPVVRAALERIAARVPVVWDPHPRGGPPVPGVSVVTPNRSEAVALHADATSELPVVAAALRQRWTAGAVVVTDGAAGAVVADAGRAWRVAAESCPEGTDTCGAGDRFAAGVAVALARGAVLPDGVADATAEVGRWLAAGGVSTLRPTAAAGPGSGTGRSALADPPVAEDLVAAVRARGGTVVATGGCFDVLHAGHLSLLREARQLGDCLVVVLNSDDSVRRLKGSGRPVNPAADRVRMLEALRDVDAVAVFEDDTPSATLELLRPDVWVKGSDYRAKELPEREAVERHGGRLHVVPLLEGRSTTRLLQRAAAQSAPDAPVPPLR